MGMLCWDPKTLTHLLGNVPEAPAKQCPGGLCFAAEGKAERRASPTRLVSCAASGAGESQGQCWIKPS